MGAGNREAVTCAWTDARCPVPASSVPLEVNIGLDHTSETPSGSSRLCERSEPCECSEPSESERSEPCERSEPSESERSEPSESEHSEPCEQSESSASSTQLSAQQPLHRVRVGALGSG